MYGYLRQRIKHAIRFRHKRGFGVHSPFMFNLILNVIRDKKSRFQYPHFNHKELQLSGKKRKLLKLMVRIIVSQKFNRLFIIGKDADTIVGYLQRASNSIELSESIDDAQLVFIGSLRRSSPLVDEARFSNQQFVILYDLYKSQQNSQISKKLTTLATVSLDMMWYGIYIFNSKLQPGHYNLLI